MKIKNKRKATYAKSRVEVIKLARKWNQVFKEDAEKKINTRNDVEDKWNRCNRRIKERKVRLNQITSDAH